MFEIAVTPDVPVNVPLVSHLVYYYAIYYVLFLGQGSWSWDADLAREAGGRQKMAGGDEFHSDALWSSGIKITNQIKTIWQNTTKTNKKSWQELDLLP